MWLLEGLEGFRGHRYRKDDDDAIVSLTVLLRTLHVTWNVPRGFVYARRHVGTDTCS